jgi:hypothetical protein
MRTRRVSRYLHVARKCIDMAEQASHPNNRETLVRFAAIWLSLAADELTEASQPWTGTAPTRKRVNKISHL